VSRAIPLGAEQYHPNPSPPRFRAPAGTVDAHCHVFGPRDVFPYASERKYTPGDAPKAALFKLRDFLGLQANVIVQASCHGRDNRAMVDALETSDNRARGVATIGPDITRAELKMLNRAGVRGVRFNFIKRLVDFTPRDELEQTAAKIAELDWHTVVYFEMEDLAELAPFFTGLPTTVVVDHMGRPDVAKGVEDPGFQSFLRLLEDNPHIWVKVTSPERLSILGPPYIDVVPFGRTLVERFPDRVLWGTDWPHPNMTTHLPDDGELMDMVPQIAPTPDLQRRLLVDNPQRLYWSD
jgi:2-pyrone-4,6-dicarboxylate lactonase